MNSKTDSLLIFICVFTLLAADVHGANENDASVKNIDLDRIPISKLLPTKNIHGVTVEKAKVFDYDLEKRGTPEAIHGYGKSDNATLSFYIYGVVETLKKIDI